ncbi:MAG: hypothetical protein ACHQNA_09675 [Acidimicrobiales bacterium]
MANDYDITARNIGVDAIAALGTRWAAHTADPGGANSATAEVSGGSPAYARKAVAWNAASAGAAAQNGDVVLDIPAGTTVTYVSLWNTAGTVRYLKKAVTSEAFGAQGTYTIKGTTSTLDLNDA